MTATEEVGAVILTAVKAAWAPLREELGRLKSVVADLQARAPVAGPAGEKGADGANGIDGKDGQDAPPIDTDVIVKTVLALLPAPKDGVDGKDGAPGIDGTNGKDGSAGTDGKDGAAGLDGKDGRDGVDGKSVDLPAVRAELQNTIDWAVKDAVKALPPAPVSLSDDDITEAVSALCTKAFEPFRLPPVQWQKRVVRDAHGRVESVVEEPVA